MATFGQQLQAKQESEQQGQPTRSERLIQQAKTAKFEGLKAQAQQIQETEFKDKIVQTEETYYDYRPSSYSATQWNRLSENDKQRILRQYSGGRGYEYYANQGLLVRIPRTRTVEKTIPFTLDEGENSYENIYANLSPDLKQFFAPPEQLKAERSTRIQSNISKADERIQMAKQRITELDAKYQQDRQNLQDWWQSKSSSYRNDPRNRENYNQQKQDLEDRYEEKTAEQQGLIEGFNKGRGELSSMKDIDFNAIENYASDFANYFESREQARNEGRKAQQKAIKDLEVRNKEAQAKGFNMTGLITESMVDQKTGKEKVTGTRYYLGGAQVSGQEFAKKFDVYQKPSGSQLVVAKGTDLSKLSQSQLETLFPVEFAKAKEAQTQKNLAFQSNVQALPVSEPSAQPAPKKSFFRTAYNAVGDVFAGLFLKSTAGIGTRGFVSGEPTALTGDELAQKREEALDKITIFGFTRGELVRDQPAPKTRFNLGSFIGIGGIPGLIDVSGAQIASYKFSKEIRESGESAIQQRKVDVANIETGAQRLQDIDTEVSTLNQQIEKGNVKPEEAQTKYTDIEQKRFAIFQDLASKGIKTNIETDQEGIQTVSFTSKSLQADLSPASVKILQRATPFQKGVLIAGGLGTEAIEFGTIGLISGGTGTSAKVGFLLTKLPKGVQIGIGVVGGGALLTNIGYSGYKGIETGQQAGIGKTGGFLLGASIPITQTLAFAGGSYVGNKIYTENIIEKFEKGGFTKPIQEETTINGKKIKYPAQVRGGQTEFTDQGQTTKVVQGDKLKTKIPGTDIEIDTSGRIKGKYVNERGLSSGESISTVTGKDAGVYQNQKTFTRALYFDKEGGETAIVTFTKTQKGVRVDQFITGTKANDFKILEETAQGGQTVFTDFNRYVSKVGDPIYVKGASLSDDSLKSILNRFIGKDQLFTGFGDDLVPYTVGRTQQIISISPKVAKGGTFDFGAGTMDIISENVKVQNFASVGTSRVARTDALKDILAQINREEGGFAVFTKSFLSNKQGQLALPSFTSPETITTPTTIKIPASIFSQDQFTAISPFTSELEGVVRSALGKNALLGSLALADLGLIAGTRGRTQQNLKSRLFQLNLQNINLTQIEIPTQQQNQTQKQAQQQLQQQLQQPQIEIPFANLISPGISTPSAPRMKLPDFDQQLLDLVRGKAQRKRQKKELSYTQDFTSKILDLPTQEISQKQLKKLIGETQTGFEIRAPVIVRGNSYAKDQKRLKKLLAQ